MGPRPTSPTSLLWAHQLAQQHALLLDRMKIMEGHMMAVEAANEDLEERVKGTEDLEERVKATEADNKIVRKVAESYKASLQRVEEVQKDNNSQREDIKQLSARMEEGDAKFQKLMRKITALEEREKQNSTKCATLTKQARAADTALAEEIKKRESAQHEFDALRTQYERYRRETDDEILRLSSVYSQGRAAVARMEGAVEELSRANHITNVLAQDTQRRLQVVENSMTNQSGPAFQTNQGHKRSQAIEQVETHQDKEATPISQASTLVEVRNEDELIVQRPKKSAKANFISEKQVQAVTQDVRQTKSMAHVEIPAQPTQQKRRAPSPSAALQPTEGNRRLAQNPVRPRKKRRQIIQEFSDEDLLAEIQYG